MPKATANSNETAICKAITQLLEFKTGCKMLNSSSPEDDRSGPPVERLYYFENCKYAVEHTLVESFPSQIHANKIAQRLDVALSEFLAAFQKVSEGTYHLFIAADLTGLSGSDKFEQFVQKIKLWVHETADDLEVKLAACDKNPWGELVRCEGCFQGIEVALVLTTKRRPKHYVNGSIRYSRIAPENLDSARLIRIRTALKNKLPKLLHYKTTGYKTILVLEDQDLALSNSLLVRDAIRNSVPTSELPDEILFVDTSSSVSWYFEALYSARRWPPNIVLDKNFALYESLKGQFDWSAN